MGQRATGGIKRCAAVAGPATDLSCAAKNRVTEVTWLPAPELQHFRGFRGCWHNPRDRMKGYHGYRTGEKVTR